MDSAKEKIIQEILQEREKQDLQWGGPDHDDKNRPWDWLTYINTQMSRTIYDSYRYRLVKIAALAVAALESLDRKIEKGDYAR